MGIKKDDFEKTILMASIAHDFSIKLENENMKKPDTLILKVPTYYSYEDAEYLRDQFKLFFSHEVFVMYDDVSIQEMQIEDIRCMRNNLNKILGED